MAVEGRRWWLSKHDTVAKFSEKTKTKITCEFHKKLSYGRTGLAYISYKRVDVRRYWNLFRYRKMKTIVSFTYVTRNEKLCIYRVMSWWFLFQLLFGDPNMILVHGVWIKLLLSSHWPHPVTLITHIHGNSQEPTLTHKHTQNLLI